MPQPRREDPVYLSGYFKASLNEYQWAVMEGP